VNFLPAYLDSSALLKLIIAEPESDALEQALHAWPDWVSSAVAAVECRRALTRVRAPAGVRRRAGAVLDATTLIRIDEPVVRLAGDVGPRTLRALDAIHLATALTMGDDPEVFITYDDRLAAAAESLKLRVLQPGRRADRPIGR
jgi:predicted nucleic acid-binding protein